MNIPQVLIVDDDQDFLSSICYEFQELFAFTKCLTAAEALTYLEGGLPVDVVLSDEKMPGMSGVDLLKICAVKWPYITRVMMTGEMDNEQLFRCINEVGLFGFIVKDTSDDFFDKNFENLLKDAYFYRQQTLNFKESVDVRTNKKVKEIYDVRREHLQAICSKYGFDIQVLSIFESLLKTVANKKLTTWADAVLFEEKFDEQMFKLLEAKLLFLTKKINLSENNHILSEFFDWMRATRLNELPGTPLLFYCLWELNLRFTPTISTTEIISDTDSSNAVRNIINATFPFSVLDISCNRSEDTISKNALLLTICNQVRMLGATIEASTGSNQFLLTVKFPVTGKE